MWRSVAAWVPHPSGDGAHLADWRGRPLPSHAMTLPTARRPDRIPEVFGSRHSRAPEGPGPTAATGWQTIDIAPPQRSGAPTNVKWSGGLSGLRGWTVPSMKPNTDEFLVTIVRYCWRAESHARGRVRVRHRMGGVLDLLARGGLLHEKGPRPLVPRAAHQGGGRRLGDSLAPLGSLPRRRPQLGSIGVPASGSSSSRSGWGSRSGPACTSGATGAPRCRRRTNRSW